MSTEERKQKFLDTLGQTSGNVSAACRAAGVSRNTYYKWRRKDAAFAAQCDMVTDFLAAAAAPAAPAALTDRTPRGVAELDPDTMLRRYSGRPAAAIRAHAVREIRAAMKEAGTYSPAFDPMIKTASIQCAMLVMAFSEADSFAFHQTETNVAGSVRLTCNPAYERITGLAERYARTLSRLGLQYDRRAAQGEDTLSDFFNKLDND